jgi:hypothetical protein
MDIRVIKLDSSHTDLLHKFCDECGKLGFSNNASLKDMKFNGKYDLGEVPTFFATLVDGEIAGVMGSHSLDGKSLRVGFRGAALPKFQGIIKGLSKTHMTNIIWAPIMPELMLDGLERGYTDFYITTSHTTHDVSGKMHITHRAMSLLCKQGILSNAGVETYYYVPQTKWKFNLSKFFQTVRAFDSIRQELNIVQYRYYSEHPLLINI